MVHFLQNLIKFSWYVLTMRFLACYSSILTCLANIRPLLANSACVVNLLEESGTLVSHESTILFWFSQYTSVIVECVNAFSIPFRLTAEKHHSLVLLLHTYMYTIYVIL